MLRVNAQTISPQVINSTGGGGQVGSSNIEVYYNIGEPIISTISNTYTITQGFLQTNEASESGLSASAFITPNSCGDKTDGAIAIAASILGGANQNDFEISYYWNSTSLCASANTCSLVVNLPAGTYSVLVVSRYLPSGAAIPNDTVKLTNLVIAGSTEPCQITVYNGVSPNGDGTNDFFYIENIDQFTNNRVEIFNRWGQKLADIANYNNSTNLWSGIGNSSSQVLPSGTYFYTIDLANGSKPIKGWLELTSGK